MGQYTIGTFVADATNQMVTLTGGNGPGVDTDSQSCTALINAYQLRVIAPVSGPVFTNVIRVGDNIILQGSNGVPQGAYQMLRSADLSQPLGNWQHIGIKSFDAGGNFNFSNALSSDTVGFYRLQALSTGPVYPPEITSDPQDLTVAAGQTASFNVTATGTDLTYWWYYNTNTILSSGTSSTLTLSGLQVSDSGKISVTASNLIEVASSAFATLTVTGVPPVITLQPTNLVVGLGQMASFSVTAGGTAPLHYQWYYDTNTALAGETNRTLTLSNVSTNQTGRYSVTITNLYGATDSDFATLTVPLTPPAILTQPANLAVKAGQTADFSVTATGALPLAFQWYYNTNTLLAGETNNTLTLLNVNASQAGKYSVTITNLYGATNSAYATLSVNPEVLAFPEAEGYGKNATGGRGGAVYEVTTLNPTGPGSLGAAIDASGPRTVVFRVGGTIVGNFEIRNDNITIAGQTAPGDGICIKGNLYVSANNVIIRYLRVRQDTSVNPESDAMTGRFHQNIILDHVSASWSGDEVMSLYHNTNVTIQWCMIAEACAKFINGTNTGHQFGGIWGNNYSTYHHNLIADNVSRNPRWASGCGYNDYRNNVIYNWNYNSCYGGEAMQDGATNQFSFTTVNMVANYYKAGPATQSGVRRRIAEPSGNVYGVGSWYVADNYVDGYPAVTADNWQGVDGTSYVKMNAPWDAMPINQQTAEAAYTNVLAKVGCFKPHRDSVDASIIQDVANGTATYGDNGIFTYPTDGGGWPTLASGTPPVDSDHDGMPDSWEIAHGLNPNDPSDRNTIGPDGYTHLEEYLNELGAF